MFLFFYALERSHENGQPYFVGRDEIGPLCTMNLAPKSGSDCRNSRAAVRKSWKQTSRYSTKTPGSNQCGINVEGQRVAAACCLVNACSKVF